MKKALRALVLFVTFSVLAGSAQASPAPEPQHKKKGKKAKASVTIVNKSKYAIHHFYLAFWDDRNWGPDQLGKDTIEPGESFTLTDIDCDWYDIQLVDEDGDECVVEDIDLCGDSEKWVITNNDLLKCQGW